jgi:hypothetical protein
MFQSKDGKKFGSAFVARRRDKEHEQSMSTEAPDKAMVPKEESRTNDMGEAKMSKMNASAPDNDVETNPDGVDANQVASEHGPATSVHVKHDHQANTHHVTSMHKDGHVHMSKHGSAKEAHDAAAQLGGEANTENTDSPANEDAGDGDLFGNDGFKTPKLA